MGPVCILAWSLVRRRWATLLLLTVVLGLTGAGEPWTTSSTGTIEAYVDDVVDRVLS